MCRRCCTDRYAWVWNLPLFEWKWLTIFQRNRLFLFSCGTQCASLLLRQQYAFLCSAHDHFKKWVFSIFELCDRNTKRVCETLEVATACYLSFRCLTDCWPTTNIHRYTVIYAKSVTRFLNKTRERFWTFWEGDFFSFSVHCTVALLLVCETKCCISAGQRAPAVCSVKVFNLSWIRAILD